MPPAAEPVRSGPEFNGRTLMRRSLPYLLATAIAGLIVSGAAAQEPPALQGVSAQEKSRVTALIDAAKQEGALTYWDVVIQPETNDALTGGVLMIYRLTTSCR